MKPSLTFADQRIGVALQHLTTIGPEGALPVMRRIGRYMLTSTQLRFREQRGPNGQAWWPSERARREGGQTLRDTGRLLRSLTWRAGRDYAEAGTNVPYAAAHQFGVRKAVNIRPHRRTAARGHGERGAVSVSSHPVRAHVRLMFLPARPFAGFSNADEVKVLTILREGIQAAIQK